MKRTTNIGIVALLLVCSLFSLNIRAQGPGGPGRGSRLTEEDIRERAEIRAKALELSDDQYKKILAIDLDFYNKMQIERQKMMNAERTQENRDAMRAKMIKMRDDRNEQYQKVLTPEQFKRFNEMEEQRRSEMRQQRQQNNPDGGQNKRSERGRG